MKIQPQNSPASSTRTLANSLTAMEAQFEAIASNLANVSTPGHKRMMSGSQTFAASLQQVGGAPSSERVKAWNMRDFSRGDLTETGDPMDLSLDGDGFLAVDFNGEVQYTRFVHAHVDEAGFLVDQRGGQLIAQGGPVQVGFPAPDLQIRENGDVLGDGQLIETLRIVEVDNPRELGDAGRGLYVPTARTTLRDAESTHLRPGYRERSNVNSLQEMVRLISLQHQFQAAHRAVASENELRSGLIQSFR